MKDGCDTEASFMANTLFCNHRKSLENLLGSFYEAMICCQKPPIGVRTGANVIEYTVFWVVHFDVNGFRDFNCKSDQLGISIFSPMRISLEAQRLPEF